MQKPENYVRNLDACVVDVVLNLDVPAGVAEEAQEFVAQHRVRRWPMCAALFGLMLVCSAITLGRIGAGGRGFLRGLPERAHEIFCTVEEKIQVTGARHLDSSDAWNRLPQRIRNFLCERGSGFFRRLASSKQTGEAASPMASFGGRSVAMGTSVL